MLLNIQGDTIFRQLLTGLYTARGSSGSYDVGQLLMTGALSRSLGSHYSHLVLCRSITAVSSPGKPVPGPFQMCIRDSHQSICERDAPLLRKGCFNNDGRTDCDHEMQRTAGALPAA